MAKLENKNTNNEEPNVDQPVIKKKRPLFLRILSTVSYAIIILVALLFIIINLPVTKRYIESSY
jgi:cytoskeletal protein RodZ